MGQDEIVAIVAIAIVVLPFLGLALTLWGNPSHRSKMKSSAEIDWKAAGDTEIQDSIARGRKIEAIKRYRELTDVGLKEAKDTIEYLIAHPDAAEDKTRSASSSLSDAGLRDLINEGDIVKAIEVYQQFAGVDYYTAKAAVEDLEREVRLGENTSTGHVVDDPELLEHIAAGLKIHAVKRYRDLTGVGLKEAKDTIDSMIRGQ